MNKEKTAKIIRMLSVPPVMITVLVLLLVSFKHEYFIHSYDAAVCIILLGIVPVLAYPLQKLLPRYKDSGRDGQRKLAFITNLIGYTAAFIWALYTGASKGLLLLCSTYFLSVIILTICNLLHFKASGHASSFTGPLLILVYAFGLRLTLPCVLVAIAIMWSSLYLKRHTLAQLIAGILACVMAFVISLFIVYI